MHKFEINLTLVLDKGERQLLQNRREKKAAMGTWSVDAIVMPVEKKLPISSAELSIPLLVSLEIREALFMLTDTSAPL